MNTTVSDVMTTDVVVVDRSARFKDVARLMAHHRVSAIPVVEDGGRLVGIVSEADLLLKETGGADIRRFERGGRHRERTKAEAVSASELMTSPVVSIGPDASVRDAARVMHRERVKRLPVIDAAGVVIGIVSRRDLLKVFLRSDDEIVSEIRDEVLRRSLWMDPNQLDVMARGGVVFLRGEVERASLVPILVGIVRAVDGVVDVVSDLTSAFDDRHLHPDVAEPWAVLPSSLRWP
jgi:CBS-domain-containing membrane protein